jgi:hypothetical protein
VSLDLCRGQFNTWLEIIDPHGVVQTSLDIKVRTGDLSTLWKLNGAEVTRIERDAQSFRILLADETVVRSNNFSSNTAAGLQQGDFWMPVEGHYYARPRRTLSSTMRRFLHNKAPILGRKRAIFPPLWKLHDAEIARIEMDTQSFRILLADGTLIRSCNISDNTAPDLQQVDFWTLVEGHCDGPPAPDAVKHYPAILAQ